MVELVVARVVARRPAQLDLRVRRRGRWAEKGLVPAMDGRPTARWSSLVEDCGATRGNGDREDGMVAHGGLLGWLVEC